LTTNKEGEKERLQRDERERDRIVAMERRRERIIVAIAPTFFSHILREIGILTHVAPQESSILEY
jgi:hypothetical protein